MERQETAAPWHDWNDRVAAECYSRNSASRILDSHGDIRKICNNYSMMSFNMGPTLLSWMKEKSPRCYKGIVDADALSMKRFGGHGSAIAQVYNHMIMPLSNSRDKRTQVKWGMADFKSHFGRLPEGMWLAETAVDTDTLEALAESGVKYTILAPKQASEIRKLSDNSSAWQDVKWEKVDTSRAYRCELPSGKSIAIFFYDGSLSHAIAFEGLLNDGKYFAGRLIDAKPETGYAVLSNVATDGESYGHHHDHGDMALSYCLEAIENRRDAQLTIYGQFLEENPPQYLVRIVENSSWSCAHGVERWRSDCGCSAGTPGYNQKWRAPLREALDWLRDKLIAQFEYMGAKYLKDPWEARDDYIEVILNRSRPFVDSWIASHAGRDLTGEEKTEVLKLMESQRCAMLMYTSCGWFFDEISGLEGTQILRYAARAISLMRELNGLDFEITFTRLLEKAPSNVREYVNGKKIYETLVKPSSVFLASIAAHYGIIALFPEFAPLIERDLWCFDRETKTVINDSFEEHGSKNTFAAGTIRLVSEITWEEKTYAFAARHKGEISMICGVSPLTEKDSPMKTLLTKPDELRKMLQSSNTEQLTDFFDRDLFSMRHVLGDAQKILLDSLLKDDTTRIEAGLREIVHDYDRLFKYLATMSVKPPSIIVASAAIVLNSDIVKCLSADVPNTEDLRRHLNRAKEWGVALDNERIGFTVTDWLMKQLRVICAHPTNQAEMSRVSDILELFINDFKWRLSLYEAQNIYNAALKENRHSITNFTSEMRDAFVALGRVLRFANEAILYQATE
ncbi:glycoside hydrolase [Synergistales bacterium]|nr:glycoside hydrolase [Synergistales bacterium]